MNVKVHSMIGEFAMTTDDGLLIYSQIHPALKEGAEVELDFSSVRVFASPFFNASLGKLLQDIRPESLDKLLRCSHLSPVGHAVMKKVLENAEEYYYRPELRQALDEIIRRSEAEDVDK